MVGFGILELLKPLEQLAFASDAIRRQARKPSGAVLKRVVDVQHFACVERLKNGSRISAGSIVDAIDTAARPPSGVMNLCSGDVDGDVTRCPFRRLRANPGRTPRRLSSRDRPGLGETPDRRRKR